MPICVRQSWKHYMDTQTVMARPWLQGCVYTAYGAFCISLIPRMKHLDTAARSGGFPQSIAGSWWGDIMCAPQQHMLLI